MNPPPPSSGSHLSPFATAALPASSCVPSATSPSSQQEQQQDQQQHQQQQDSFNLVRSRLWTDFQSTATALSKMYRDGQNQMPDASAQQREFWSSFQLSAASLTQFYKSAIESVELIHQQNHQQQNRTAAAAPPLVSPMQCSACSQKVTWCQNCNTYTPTNPGGGRLAATAAATSPEASGKKSPPGSPFQHQATAAAMVEQSNRLKRTREMASAADDSDYFPESMFIKRFRRNHDHPDIV